MKDSEPVLTGEDQTPGSCCEPYRQLLRYFMGNDDTPEHRKRMGDVALMLFEAHVNRTVEAEAQALGS